MKRRLLLALLLTLMPRLALADVCSALPQASTMTGWWTADSISASDGDPVTSWADSSGSLNTAASQGTAPVYKTNIVNSLPVVRFAGSGGFDLPVSRASNTFTFMAVVKASSSSNYRSILGDANGGRDWYLVPSTNVQGLAKSYTASLGSSNTGVGTTDFHVLTVVYNGSTTSFYIDGAADGGAAASTTFSHTQTAHLGYSAVQTNEYFIGDIAQAMQWESVLSAADRCEAIRCLGAEYGISINETACADTPTPTQTPTGTRTPSQTPTQTATKTPTATPLPTFTSEMYLATFAHGDANHLYIYQTLDGKNFTTPGGCTNPVAQFPGVGGSGLSASTLAASILHYNSKYWVAYEIDSLVACHNMFGIMSADNICGPYTWVTDVTAAASGTNSTWNPRWFVDDDGSLHINVNVGASCVNGSSTYIQPVMLDPTAADLTTWSAPTAITGAFIDESIYDTYLVSPANSPSGQYSLWYACCNAKVQYATSASRTSGYVKIKTGDWAGWVANNAGIEGPALIKRTGSVWRIFLDIIGYGGGYAFSDSTGSDWANWQSGLTGISTDPSVRTGTGAFMVEAAVGTNTPTQTPTRTATPTGVINTATPTQTPTPATFAGSSINRRFPNSHCCPAASPQCVTQDSPTYCTSDAECPVGDVCYKMPLSSSVIRDNFDAAADDIEALQAVIWPLNLNPPALSAGCGSGASVAGGDDAGKITIGTSPSSSCIVTFNITRTTDPVCYAVNETTGTVMVASATASALTISGTFTNGSVVKYLCAGR